MYLITKIATYKVKQSSGFFQCWKYRKFEINFNNPKIPDSLSKNSKWRFYVIKENFLKK